MDINTIILVRMTQTPLLKNGLIDLVHKCKSLEARFQVVEILPGNGKLGIEKCSLVSVGSWSNLYEA